MANLKKRTFKALAWDMGGTMVRQGANLITGIVLARLLGPEEFGLIGMAMVFIAISEVFIDVGFSSALIQNKDNTNLTYSSIFYLNVVAGIVLTLMFYFLAPLIGQFYENQQVVTLVRWLSLIFLFNSGNLVQTAILKKNLNFKVITVRMTVSAAIGGVAGVIAAFSGWGIYSLVLQHVVTAVAGTVLLWSISGWKPDLKFSMSEVKKLTGFSSYIFFDRVLSSVFQRLDVLLIGKIFSPTILGFYTRAVSLKDFVRKYTSTSVMKVLYPVLSEVQDDEVRFRKIYYKLISVLAFVSFGLTGLMFVLGRDIIILLFGPKWEPSVEIFQVIILSVTNYPISALMVNAFLSKGKSKENFYLGLFRKVLRAFPFLFAYWYGILEFTMALVAFNYLIIFVNMIYMSRYVHLDIYTHCKKLFEATLPLIALVAVFYYAELDIASFSMRLLTAVCFVFLYLIYNWVIQNEGLNFVNENIRIVFMKIRKLAP